MNRRGLIPIIVLNIIISASVGFGVLTIFGNRTPEIVYNELGTPIEQGVSRLVTFVVVHTATPDPNATPMIVYQVITATPDGMGVMANIPPEARDDTDVALPPAPTLDPSVFTAAGQINPEAPLPEGCLRHTLQSGESPSSLGVTYGVSFFDIMAVNNLTEETARLLQIGAVLIIPMENCPRESFITAQPTRPPTQPTEDTNSVGTETEVVDVENGQATPVPTITLAPTASNLQAQVEVVEVTGVGDITREQVVIRNNGNTVDISGWTLSNGAGDTFTFPSDRRLFSGAGVTINTRAGTNTPVLFFWGRDLPAFTSGDVVILKNREGEVVSSLRLP